MRLAAAALAAAVALPAAASGAPQQMPAPAPAAREAAEARRLADVAARLDAAEATLVVGAPGGGSAALRLHPERAAEPLPPCSTFKIPNSLIALTAGAVTRNNNRIAYDPERDPEQEWWPDNWAEDQDMPSALRRSAVWYYRELARRVGRERMQAQLDRIGYGNRDISGGIDRFWLSSSLVISADEQVDFLAHLATGQLGFLPEHERYVADALVQERGTEAGAVGEGGAGESGEWRLVAKTGSCTIPGGAAAGDGAGAAGGERWVGWLVGWIERRGVAPRPFAFNTRGASYAEIRDERGELAVASLRALGFLPAASP